MTLWREAYKRQDNWNPPVDAEYVPAETLDVQIEANTTSAVSFGTLLCWSS